jgi:protocatechuate 3,4-dioxygenase beta subunit
MNKHKDGLMHDLRTMRLDRRLMLRLIGGAALVPIIGGCLGDSADDAADGAVDAGATSGSDAGATSGSDAGASSATCTAVPEETAGPYPGDGSNGANALTMSGIVREDIRSSFGSYSGTADGIPLQIVLTLVDVNASCAALSGYAVYLWHCNRDGKYSLYTQADQNYLRGVQASASDGTVIFQSIFPACYSGRWPHIHYEIYPTLSAAASVSNKIATSQIALPQAPCSEVYATTGYEQSVTNLSQITLASDNVFSDGWTNELGTVTGSPSAGYVVTLTVPIKA